MKLELNCIVTLHVEYKTNKRTITIIGLGNFLRILDANIKILIRKYVSRHNIPLGDVLIDVFI